MNPDDATGDQPLRSPLRRIEVRGFKSLRNVAVEFGDVTVLIGANGSGKSNLLQLLQLVPLMRTHSLQRQVGHWGSASSVLFRGPQQTREIQLRLEFEQAAGTNSYDARLVYAARDRLMFADEQVDYRPTDGVSNGPWPLGAGHFESALADAAGAPHQHTARIVNGCISRLSFFHFHDTSIWSQLRTDSRAVDDRYLRSDGSNLGAFLLALRESEDEQDQRAWRRISGVVQRIAPCIKRLDPVRVVPTPDPAGAPESQVAEHPSQSVRLDWIDDQDDRYGVHHLSDGTLRAIALVTALAQPAVRRPSFISIDEPELGLHPAALALVLELVKIASVDTQVVLATQSPAVLDAFTLEHVVVVERDDGASTFRRLSASELDAWLEDYTLSDLYNMNVLGGRP